MAEREGITLTEVEVSRFHRIRFAHARLIPGQGLIRVTGKNGHGKTSLLRAVRAVLGGAGEVLPEAVQEGADGATVRIQLSNGFSVARRFTAANPKGYLTVMGADGGKHGQAKLDEWLGPLSFDPGAFFDLRPDRQREILLSLGGDPGLPAKLAAIRKARAEKYEERTPWISQKRRAAQVSRPEGERPELVDISAELRRMGDLQKVERERQDALRAGDDVRRAAEEAREAANAAASRVRDLERQLASAREALEERTRLLEVADAAVSAADEATRSLVDPSEEMEEVRARIAAADQVHQALRPWEAWEKAQAEHAEAAAEIDAITAEMDVLQRQEQELIAGVGIPVDGLGFSPDGAPLLNGRPLEVASGAERIRLAVAVALAANRGLRVCLVDEANDLDPDGLAELDRLAQEHGFQVWAARIGLEGPGEVHIVDGVAGDPDEEPAEA